MPARTLLEHATWRFGDAPILPISRRHFRDTGPPALRIRDDA
jgi:hypothetical protein